MMAAFEFKPSAQLKQLVDDFHHNRIAFEDYRAQRRRLLEAAQAELNGGMPARGDKVGDGPGMGDRLISLVSRRRDKIVSE